MCTVGLESPDNPRKIIMTTSSEHQITIHLDDRTNKRLSSVAECKGVDIDRYCLEAIERQLVKDEKEQAKPHFDIEGLIAFRDELLGDRKFSKTGLEYLDEARAIRAKQMEDW